VSEGPRADLEAALAELNEAQIATLLGWTRTLRRAPGAYEGHPSVGPLGDLLGISREEMGEGRARLRLDVNPAWANPNGVLHGGVVYTLIDYSMGGAVQNSLRASTST
jgi:acyl-coenzyme A thioesterase PaaI-like protein